MRVLIVEDEPILAMDLKYLVEDIGYRVSGMVFNGNDAIRMAMETRPDIILMDIGLNGDLDGIEVSRIIKKGFEVHIIFVTGNTDQNSLDRANEINPYGFIGKPIDTKALRSILAAATNKS